MVKLALFDRALESRRMPYRSTGNLAKGMEDKEWEKRATSVLQHSECFQCILLNLFLVSPLIKNILISLQEITFTFSGWLLLYAGAFW